MRRSVVVLLLASCSAWAQAVDGARTSTDLLFAESNSSAALAQSKVELRRNSSDLDAAFAEMEAARLQLRTEEEMESALLLLEKAHGDDPRAQLAAGRIQQLAANTPVFRGAIAQLCALLRQNSRYSREVTSAILTAHADGAPLPRAARLLHHITKWQIVGPFGEFSNVDFDRTWPPERDQLTAPRYGKLIREQITSSSGELELPNYFSQNGVYYAGSTFRASAEHKYTITIEGEGTYELQLDGKRLLLHDSRFQSQTKVANIETSVPAGTHRLVLKLSPSTFPIRVWLQHGTAAPEPVPLAKPQSYAKAANALLNGDLAPALAFGDDSTSMELTLRAEAQGELQQSAQARDSLMKVASLDSTNVLAKFEIARQALAEERFEEAASYLAKVLDVARGYWPAQELKYKMSVQFDWKQERSAALKQLLRLHPACSTYAEAAKVHRYGSKGPIYESRLALCSPRPSQYWSELNERSEYGRALLSLERYVAVHPDDRPALELAIREAVLSENEGAARKYAAILRRVAPNWQRIAVFAENPERILDSPSSYPSGEEFYRPYEREPASVLTQSTSGNTDSKVLINDRVVKLEPSGSAWIYQHNVVQVFDKKGIEQAGEVDVPRGAELIELRTIKRDGHSVRPDLADRKSTVSMPSLAEGDAVELAYVQHFRAADLRATPELLDFFFASAEARSESSRLTVIRQSSDEPVLWFSPEVKQIESRAEGDTHVSTWEAKDLPASVPEPHAAEFETRTRMLWLSMDASGDSVLARRYRDQLIAATQVGPIVEQAAAKIRTVNAREAIASAYQFVQASIDEDGESWRRGNITSASDSLAQGEGNRAATLIALLSAMGFDADLEFAAERGRHGANDDCPQLRCYTHPLVRVMLANAKRPVILDPQIKGVSSGALSPEVEGENTLVIHRSRATELEIATVPQGTDQKTSAVANLDLEQDGAIRGKVRIRFGSFRGAQMRETLQQLSAKERQSYFEEIGSRIFPHASKISASVFHEDDPEKPLEVELTLASSASSRWSGSSLDLGQLIPALGLSHLYATLPVRNQDLWLETPLIEESEFTVHLPAGVEVWRMPEPFMAKSSFGDYRTDFKLEDGALKIVRSFRIPMQQIASAQYSEFSKFALQIDGAEREQLQLRRVSVAQERPSSLRPLR